MSKGNQAERTESLAKDAEPTLAELRAQVSELRGFVRTMALLTLPAQMRTPCGCGRIAERTVTLVNGKDLPRHDPLCDKCEPLKGWSQVGIVYLDGNLRETARLANSILDANPKG